MKRLSDAYENLNNLANRFYTLNNLIQQSSSTTAINNTRNNLGSSGRNLLNEKTNSPAYQAVLLALNAAVGFWNVVGYLAQCGGNANGTANAPSVTKFFNQPGYRATDITCQTQWTPGSESPLSIENMKKLNQAYQILQAALKNGLPALGDNKTKVSVTYRYTCSGEGNNNCEVYKTKNGKQEQEKIQQNGGSETIEQTIGNQQVNTTISSKVVDSQAESNTSKVSYTEITTKFDIDLNVQTLLDQAQTIMNILQGNPKDGHNAGCPQITQGNSVSGGAQWKWEHGGSCKIFGSEISAIQGMLANAQNMVKQIETINSNSQTGNIQGKDGKVFSPFTDASFAQGMLANAQAQAEMVTLANQIGDTINPEKLNGNFQYFVKNYLATCSNKNLNGNPYGSQPGEVTNQTFASGCAYVEQTITALNNSLAYFGSQAEQIKHAEDLAYTLANFSSQYAKLGDNYQAITKALPNFPGSLSNLVTSKTDTNAPNGIKTTYTPDLNAFNQLQNITQELGHNPFRRVGMIASSTTNNGAMNGIGFQVGYKQFFGEKKTWGARYYGFFDYNHAYIKSSFFNSASDVFTYGVGTDILYNFINDKATKNSKISFGVFGGIALAGTSWLNSQYVNLATFNNFYSAKMNVANFQFLFNLGLRMNLAKNKKKASDHAAQHGVELGVKIPTINTNYYSLLGTQLQYRRLYSVYLNYVFAY
ncbi:Hop family adhesin BabA [Helicobacter pylori]